jgi:hypothetical protein
LYIPFSPNLRLVQTSLGSTAAMYVPPSLSFLPSPHPAVILASFLFPQCLTHPIRRPPPSPFLCPFSPFLPHHQTQRTTSTPPSASFTPSAPSLSPPRQPSPPSGPSRSGKLVETTSTHRCWSIQAMEDGEEGVGRSGSLDGSRRGLKGLRSCEGRAGWEERLRIDPSALFYLFFLSV